MKQQLQVLFSNFNAQERGVSEFALEELYSRTVRILDSTESPAQATMKINSLYSHFNRAEDGVSEYAMTTLANRVLGIYRSASEGEDGECEEPEQVENEVEGG